MSSPLRDRLRTRLTEARRARDADLAGALRSAIAALENAEAVAAPWAGDGTGSQHVAGAAAGLGAAEAERRELDDAQERAIVEQEIAGLVAAAEQYAAHGRDAEAGTASRVATVLRDVAEKPLV